MIRIKTFTVDVNEDNETEALEKLDDQVNKLMGNSHELIEVMPDRVHQSLSRTTKISRVILYQE